MRLFVSALALSLPFAALAAEAVDMSCNATVKEFFAPLIQNRIINPKPFNVEPGSSTNHFKISAFKSVTAYGIPVIEVFGYTDEPLLFVKSGNPQFDLYGVRVREGVANVQAQLNSFGATKARAYRIDGASSIIICKGNSE